MRNGDYIPTRMEAQHDAANLVSNAKTQQNPESTVRPWQHRPFPQRPLRLHCRLYRWYSSLVVIWVDFQMGGFSGGHPDHGWQGRGAAGVADG